MRHPHARHNRAPSNERRRYTRSTPKPELGARALKDTTILLEPRERHESIIVNGHIHTIGLAHTKNERTEPSNNTYAEQATLTVTGGIEDSTFTSDRMLGNRILSSINKERDTPMSSALRHVAAKAFGRQLPDANYREDLEILNNELTTEDLRDFFVHLYESTHVNTTGSEAFMEQSMGTLSGFRVEASFVRLAERAGFSVITATKSQDQHGIDFFIDNVPFDIKSSRQTARKHARRHADHGNRIPTVAFIPPIEPADFDNHLIVPYENLDRIIKNSDFATLIHEGLSRYPFARSSRQE